jgi:hypothetical protein
MHEASLIGNTKSSLRQTRSYAGLCQRSRVHPDELAFSRAEDLRSRPLRPTLVAAIVVVALGAPGTVFFERVQRTRGPIVSVTGRGRWLLLAYLLAFSTALVGMVALLIVEALT